MRDKLGRLTQEQAEEVMNLFQYLCEFTADNYSEMPPEHTLIEIYRLSPWRSEVFPEPEQFDAAYLCGFAAAMGEQDVMGLIVNAAVLVSPDLATRLSAAVSAPHRDRKPGEAVTHGHVTTRPG